MYLVRNFNFVQILSVDTDDHDTLPYRPVEAGLPLTHLSVIGGSRR